jgi:predicted dehydrogenase
MGTGGIAGVFAQGLTALSDAELLAVGSRTHEKGDAFAQTFSVERVYGSYEELVQDKDLDVIYVATPHSEHHKNVKLALEAGKHVMCEKAFTINEREAQELIDLAGSRKLFLMEAMWSRFLPAYQRLRELLDEKVIGNASMLTADLGFCAPRKTANRLFDLSLGGGALLDAGVYPVSLSSFIFGEPEEVTGLMTPGKTGVDERSSMVFRHKRGQISTIYTSIIAQTPGEALIFGTKGSIRIHHPVFCPRKITVSIQGTFDKVIDVPFEGNGYQYEAAEVMACIREGKLQSDIMPLKETLSVMRTMDRIRKLWGLTYPNDL